MTCFFHLAGVRDLHLVLAKITASSSGFQHLQRLYRLDLDTCNVYVTDEHISQLTELRVLRLNGVAGVLTSAAFQRLEQLSNLAISNDDAEHCIRLQLAAGVFRHMRNLRRIDFARNESDFEDSLFASLHLRELTLPMVVEGIELQRLRASGCSIEWEDVPDSEDDGSDGGEDDDDDNVDASDEDGE